MNLDEAKRLARAWTTNHDVDLDGWRSVVAVLLARVEELETKTDFQLPPQPQLMTIADIIKDTQDKSSW